MGKNSSRILMQFAAFVMVLTVATMVKEATSITICNINTDDAQKCRPAITGDKPPPPVNECCVVIRAANLECLCRFKSYLPILRIDPSKVVAVLAKCGVKTVPRDCQV